MTNEVKVLGMRYDGKEGWGNDPGIVIVVDKLPEKGLPEYTYSHHDQGISGKRAFIGRSGPFGNTLVHDPNNEQGFGGGEFDLLLENGKRHKIKGPWDAMVDTSAYAGVHFVEGVAVLLGPENYPAIWDRAFNFLRELTGAERAPAGEPEFRADWYERMLNDDPMREGRKRRAWAGHDLERDFHHALWIMGDYRSIKPKVPRPFTGDPEQIKLIAQLATWFPPEGTGWSVEIESMWLRKQMEEHLPKHTLYRKAWRPEPWEGGMNRPPRIVPAPKSSSLDADYAAPKNEGWWGFTVLNQHEHPIAPFYETLFELVSVVSGETIAKNRVAGRHDGQWVELYPREQSQIDRIREQVKK